MSQFSRSRPLPQKDAIDNDEQPRGAGHDDGRVLRELCDVEKSGIIAEPCVVGLKLKETLVHVLLCDRAR